MAVLTGPAVTDLHASLCVKLGCSVLCRSDVPRCIQYCYWWGRSDNCNSVKTSVIGWFKVGMRLSF